MKSRGRAMRRPWRTLGMVAVAALLFSACGGDAGEGSAESAGGGEQSAGGDAIERPDLAVGVTPSLTFAQVFHAVEAGIFEKHGLNVEIVPKGRSDVPPLLADEYQVGTMAGATYIQAVAEGFELRALYPGVDGHTGAISIMAMPDSGIESIEDLKDRSIAINQPGAAFEIFTRIVLEDSGVGQDNVKFSVIPFSSMVEALVGGEVDAAVLTAPYNTIAQNQGAVTVVDPFEGLLERAPIAGFTVTRQFAEANPNTVDAFVRSMDEAVDSINAMSAQEYAELLPTVTEIEPEVAEQVVKPEYPKRVDVDKMQELADQMLDIGVIQDEAQIAPTLVEVDDPT